MEVPSEPPPMRTSPPPLLNFAGTAGSGAVDNTFPALPSWP